MNRKIILLLGLSLIVLLNSCSNADVNANANRYIKLSDYIDGTRVAFIDSKTQEVFFLDLIDEKITKRISIK